MQNELKRIEDDLVPVYETSTGERVVYGSELHAVLEVKSPYRIWAERRISDIEASENEDYTSVQICTVSGGTPRKDHIIKLDTAKEMAMLERNEKGKQVRRYFIAVEKKYRAQREAAMVAPQTPAPMQGLSPQLQLLINMELKQKELDEKYSELESRADRQGREIRAVREAMAVAGNGQDFSKWVISSIKTVAESRAFEENPYRFQAAWVESYKRLTEKAGCNLDVLLKNAKKRAEQSGATKSQVKDISKLSMISNDRRLKELYIAAIREMMIAYCVDVG